MFQTRFQNRPPICHCSTVQHEKPDVRTVEKYGFSHNVNDAKTDGEHVFWRHKSTCFFMFFACFLDAVLYIVENFPKNNRKTPKFQKHHFWGLSPLGMASKTCSEEGSRALIFTVFRIMLMMQRQTENTFFGDTNQRVFSCFLHVFRRCIVYS